jgi:heterodisulfide reductase subunit B
VELLHKDLGVVSLKSKLANSFSGLRVAIHYGCHLLRPADVIGFDNSFSPNKLDQIVEASGAESIDWSEKLECCGAALIGVDDGTALHLARKKLESAKRAGADVICSACPYCLIQFERAQRILLSTHEIDFTLPSVAYVQLVGLSLGMAESDLGVSRGNSLMSCSTRVCREPPV